MPKDKKTIKEEVDEPKKKMVVVEEVEIVAETDPEVDSKTTDLNQVETVKNMENQNQVPASKIEAFTEDFDDEDKPNYLWIIVPTALLVGALVGGLITYFSGLSNMGQALPTPSPIVTSAPTTETPEPSPTTSIKREDLKVQILNGSGVSGAAGKAKTLLEGLGYKNIDTGNASTSDFEKTEVAVKEGKKDYSDLVIKDLSKSYEASLSSKSLSSTSKYDIVITLGKK